MQIRGLFHVTTMKQELNTIYTYTHIIYIQYIQYTYTCIYKIILGGVEIKNSRNKKNSVKVLEDKISSLKMTGNKKGK